MAAIDSPTQSKNEAVFGANENDTRVSEAEFKEEVGGLQFDQYLAGGLGRHLGIFSTTSLIIGRIIGTGIFSTPSSIVNGVGSLGASMLLWLLGLLLSVAGLCVWLEFACMIPRSGGEKVYLEAAYRRPKMLITTVFAVQAIALGFTASGCIVFASNILVAANKTVTEWAERGIAIGVIVSVTLIHTFVPKLGVHGMNAFTVLKIILLLFIVITGWVVLGGGVSRVPDPHASFHDSFAGSAKSGNPYATALFKVLNSYAGWSNAMYVLNEVKDPVRTVKIAGPLGLSTCGILYILANVAYFSAATPAEIAASGTTVASFFMKKVFGSAAQRALSVLVALSAYGNVMTVTFAQSRVNQELAKEGVIPYPRFWASSWPFGSPSAGLILHFIPSFIVIVAIPFGDAYNFILDVEGYPGAVINFLVVAGLFYLRWSEPNAPRPFKVWLPVAAFFMVGQAFQLVAPFLRPPGGKGDTSLPYWLYAVVGISILAASVVYWAIWWVLAPKLGGYTLEPHNEPLKDGTNLTDLSDMGCWDSFCCFCSGPLDNAQHDWLRFLTIGLSGEKWPPADGEWFNDRGYPVPSQPLDQIVTISDRDGQSWNLGVSVTPNSPETFVTALCSVGSYGDVTIKGVKDKLHLGSDLFLLIHPMCLSFLCRHANITPRELWESVYKENSCYQMYGGELNGLLYCVNYYDMQERSGQAFEYALVRHWPPSDRPDLPPARWYDPGSMEDTKWLLARPTLLPTPKTLQRGTVKASTATCRKVFDTTELFDIILGYIVDIPSDVIKEELRQNKRSPVREPLGKSRTSKVKGPLKDIFEASSAIIAAQTLLSLAQVDRWFYDAIIQKRQGLFLQAMRNFGWMLPFTPADWSDNSWVSEILADTSSSRQADIDWRHYMLTCVKKDLPSIRNRWRFHKMATQFARGTNRYRSKEHPDWFWNAGNLGFRTSLNKPEPNTWELCTVYAGPE
ncbi:amino acid permease domain-containing protein [Trichoderma chlorosporum]